MNWIWSTVTPTVRQMSSVLSNKPELDIAFDEEDLLENPELAEMMSEFDAYIGGIVYLYR